MYSYCDICWVILPTITIKDRHLKLKTHILNEKVLSSRELKEDLNDYFCSVCVLELDSEEELSVHLKSKTHLRKVFDKNYILDFKAKIFNDSNQIVDSYKIEPLSSRSMMHKSSTFSGNLPTTQNKVDTEVQLSLPTSNSFIVKKEILFEKNCEICYILFTSSQHREQHINGNTHKKRMEIYNLIQNSKTNIQNLCEICYLIIPNEEQFSIHLNSDKHKKSLLLKNELFSETIRDINYNNLSSTTLDIDDICQNLQDDEKTLETFTEMTKTECVEHCVDKLKNELFTDVNSGINVKNMPSFALDLDNICQNFLNNEQSFENCEMKEDLNDYFCSVCVLELDSEEELSVHLKSKKHLRKVFDKNYILDLKAKISSDSNEMVDSYKIDPLSPRSKMHKSSTFSGTLQGTTVQLGLPTSNSFIVENEILFEKNCEICYILFTSSQHREQHINGNTHKKRMEIYNLIQNSKTNIQNLCEICYLIIPNEEQFSIHLNSDKHKKSLLLKNELFSKTITDINVNNMASTTLDIDDICQNLQDDEQNLETFTEMKKIECVEHHDDSKVFFSCSFLPSMNEKWNKVKQEFDKLVESLNSG